ncbi:MAG: hypothetical protein QNK05_03080 [Myxococcota bacterium]|nr:hypothetical protein [Myxococcota bacterium]
MPTLIRPTLARRLRLLVAPLALLALAGSPAAADDWDAVSGDFPELFPFFELRLPGFAPKRLCTGVRGNGNRIFAHFGSQAQITGSYGPLSGAAGGSSGSITVFLAESIQANPLMWRCGGRPCTRTETSARIALQWKTMQALTQTGIGLDVTTLLTLVERVQQEGILELLQDPATVPQGVDAFLDLLRDLGGIVNPELFTLIANSPDPVFHITDIVEATQKGLSFIVDETLVFVRPGLLNWDELATLFGRLGSFYAGYGPYDRPAVRRFLDQCAVQSLDLDWDETSVLPAGDSTCGQLFIEQFDAYREAFDLEDSRSRIDDPIGRFLPNLATTGVIVGSGVAKWEQARADYFAATPTELELDFATEVKFGYWGRRDDLRVVRRGLRRESDLGSQKFRALGRATWRTILTASPAEPGLSAGVPLPGGEISVGGWDDPLRVLVLDALRCRHTIGVNRPGGVGGFTSDVTTLLGATPADLDALYEIANPQSSFSVGLARNEGNWCSDWDTPDGFDVEALFEVGFNAPFVTDDPFFLNGPRAYPGADPDLEIFGCTAGFTGP